MTQRKPIRSPTIDRGPPEGERIEIHTTEQIGPNMSKLPNGSLLCRNVPIARVGWMVYGPGETPIEVSKDTGLAYVVRDAETLFSPECIGSFMGAAIVDEHPDDDVTPDNWRKLSKGFATTNVRQGTGDDADILLADLIITDADLIKAVLDGKREVSCGYDADYSQTGEGQGKQTGIIGNHIALVEKGRCGPRCAIGDRAHQPKEKTMKTKSRILINRSTQRRVVLDAAQKRVRDAEAELEQAQELADAAEGGEPGNGDTHIHIHAGGKADTMDEEDPAADPAAAATKAEGGDRMDALEASVMALADQVTALTEAVRKIAGGGDEGEGSGADEGGEDLPDAEEMTEDGEPDPEDMKKEKEKEGKTTDSRALATSYAKTLAQAEVLVPGFRMPTFDAKAKRKATIDSMCAARRKALGAACATHDGATLVTAIHGSAVTLDKMTCVEVAALFKSAAGAKALMNNKASTTDAAKPNQQESIGSRSIADVNAANTAYWAARQPK